MRERLFRFKQFAVSHRRSAMKVGTDGVTLGAWASVMPGDSVLDVGCGCGLIGLMMAQRGAARVCMLDVDTEAAAEAADNAAASPWTDRVGVCCADFAEFQSETKFQRIVSNPPFFVTGAIAPDAARAAARHESSLTVENLLRKALTLLAPGGTISLILPAEREPEMLFTASVLGLHPVRLARMAAGECAPVKRVLVELQTAEPTAPAEPRLLLIDSDEYRTLTSPFYL
jgi:tRNA1Val (adenine37-N6)-methyltransferase